MARFDETFCSQCGGEFGPGYSGFSHCDQHEGRTNYDGLSPAKHRFRCPYPIDNIKSALACMRAGHCMCDNNPARW